MFGPFRKEKPLPGLIGLGGGAAGALVHAGAVSYTHLTLPTTPYV